MLPRLVEYAVRMIESYNPSKIITGMALGWDQALAHASIVLGVPFIAAVPFVGQESVWKPEAKDVYHELLSKASEVVVVCEGGFASSKYIKRDEWMVDHGEAMLALWNGQKHGGTYHCIKYAQKVNRPVFNVWPGWSDFQAAA
jgi:uncharacterized phage-like protein YoqJ